MPRGDQPEQQVDLEEPVPVYITYLTAVGTTDGAVFRNDPYQRHSELLARYFPAAG